MILSNRSYFRLILIPAVLVGALCISYFMTAYEFIPLTWRFVERRHPALDLIDKRAFTAAGIPGDPLNIAFVGDESALHKHMLAAGWYPADPITLASSLRIARASVLHKPYPDAPVSNLFLSGHKQYYAFEQADGGDPSKRHHVRFWFIPILDNIDRPLWIGAATYDSGVGISHTTGQITHHIAAQVDTERDKLVADLLRSGDIELHWVDPFQTRLEGKNGGGDHFVTDGRLALFSEP